MHVVVGIVGVEIVVEISVVGIFVFEKVVVEAVVEIGIVRTVVGMSGFDYLVDSKWAVEV